jgi:hypothetical protein
MRIANAIAGPKTVATASYQISHVIGPGVLLTKLSGYASSERRRSFSSEDAETDLKQ